MSDEDSLELLVEDMCIRIGLTKCDRLLVMSDMSIELKEELIAVKTIIESKDVLSKFSANQKQNGKRYIHP